MLTSNFRFGTLIQCTSTRKIPLASSRVIVSTLTRQPMRRQSTNTLKCLTSRGIRWYHVIVSRGLVVWLSVLCALRQSDVNRWDWYHWNEKFFIKKKNPHSLNRNLAFRQLPVQSLTKIKSKLRHFCFSDLVDNYQSIFSVSRAWVSNNVPCSFSGR